MTCCASGTETAAPGPCAGARAPEAGRAAARPGPGRRRARPAASLAGRALACLLLIAPLAGAAQPPGRSVTRVGFLSPGAPADAGRLAAFREGLRELGYVDGQNTVIEARWAEGRYDRLPGLATELVRLRVDAIVAYAAPAIRAAMRATRTIPTVMAGAIDPVASGLVASVARPGGNVTGLSLMAPELVGKQLEILTEIVPGASRVALLGNPSNAGNAPQLQQARQAARVLGLELLAFEARGPSEIDRAFAAMARARPGALIVLVDAMLIDQRARIAELAARRRLPAVYGLSDHTDAGGLVSYGPSVSDRFRRAAIFVDKILRGARPGDLPVEQPTRLALVVNQKAAAGLGLTIPRSLLLRADEIID